MIRNNFEQGYIQVYTGNGKGKTTAAIGVTIRSIAHGMKVYFGQFMKKSDSGEHTIFKNYKDSVDHYLFGTGKFIMGNPSDVDIDHATKGWQSFQNAVTSGGYDLVVADELNLALHYNLIPLGDVVNFLKNKPKSVEIIITGRYAKDEILAVADLVTEMREVKHYYSIGVGSRKGIED